MNPFLTVVIVAVLFVSLFGGLSLVKKEGLSKQFVFTALAITILGLGISAAGLTFNPILFLIVLYLVTMCSRLLVDAGNLLSSRGQYQVALSIYQLALQLKPDVVGRLSALINMGVAYLRQGSPDKAISILKETLTMVPQGIHPKYETACRYNLGIAYRKGGGKEEALREFREVIRLLPTSLYAKGAKTAIREVTETDLHEIKGHADGK